jgi:hypothetical protein
MAVEKQPLFKKKTNLETGKQKKKLKDLISTLLNILAAYPRIMANIFI